jgi:hypothetical protein
MCARVPLRIPPAVLSGVPTPRPLAIAAALAALSLSPGCHRRADDRDYIESRDPSTPRERCRASFAACAPAASFNAQMDVSTLDVRMLVQVASRLDLPDKLSADAATRLLDVARRADGATLLDIQDAIENAGFAFGRCRCEDFSPEIEKKKIAAFVASRAPPRAIRSPEHWAEKMLTPLRSIHALQRRSAVAALGGEGGGDALAAQRRDDERALCRAVHEAQGALPPATFDEAVALVYKTRAQEAGEGTAEVARTAVRKYAASKSCDAAAP